MEWDGIIGSKTFVMENYQRFKSRFQCKHEKKPRSIKGLDGIFFEAVVGGFVAITRSWLFVRGRILTSAQVWNILKKSFGDGLLKVLLLDEKTKE